MVVYVVCTDVFLGLLLRNFVAKGTSVFSLTSFQSLTSFSCKCWIFSPFCKVFIQACSEIAQFKTMQFFLQNQILNVHSFALERALLYAKMLQSSPVQHFQQFDLPDFKSLPVCRRSAAIYRYLWVSPGYCPGFSHLNASPYGVL